MVASKIWDVQKIAYEEELVLLRFFTAKENQVHFMGTKFDIKKLCPIIK